MAKTIDKSVELVIQAQDIERFTSIIPRKYIDLETNRTFHTEEQWYTVDGLANVTDELTNETYILTPGDVLICPEGSRLRHVISEEWVVKQYVDAKTKTIIDTRINVQVNWLIIQTILKALDKYDDFVAVPNETDELFNRAIDGDLYILDEYSNYVDQCIDNFVDRTEISKDIWTGKIRLHTGLEYTGKYADKIESMFRIENVNFEAIQNVHVNAITDKIDKELYKMIKRDPLGLPEITYFDGMRSSGLFTLKNLLIAFAASVLPEIDILKSIELPERSKWQPYLTDKKLPKDISYSTRIKTIIEKLYEVNI